MSTIMLYKHPGEHILHGVKCDYVIVNEDETGKLLEEGWALSPIKAKELVDNKVEESKIQKDKKTQKNNKKTIEDILGG